MRNESMNENPDIEDLRGQIRNMRNAPRRTRRRGGHPMRDQIIMSVVISAVLTAIAYFLMHGSLAGIGGNPGIIIRTSPAALFLIIGVVVFLYKAYRM
jgi:hypothetical protein